MNGVLLFSGLITFSIIAGFVALKFFPKNPLIKGIYIILGCISLVFRRDWCFSTISADHTFFITHALFVCARFFSFRTLVLGDETLSKIPKIL